MPEWSECPREVLIIAEKLIENFHPDLKEAKIGFIFRGEQQMKITPKWLKEKGACREGRKWFSDHLPSGGEIEDVLKELVTSTDSDAGWASWLMRAAEYWQTDWLKNLSVGGSLYLGNTPITSLPENLSVGGSLYLRHTPITSLPENLSVDGSLDLNYTSITSLPENLSVGGCLDLSHTPITSLPENPLS